MPVTVSINNAPVDTCLVRMPLAVVHGRSGIGVQPDAPSVDLTLEGPTQPAQVGDLLTISATTQFTAVTYDDPVATYDDPSALYDDDGTGNHTHTRFSGVVAAITATEAGGQVDTWHLACVGHLARLGYLPVLLTRPQETDVARVLAIAAAAGITVRIVGNPGVQLAADNIDRDALSALQQVCESSGGLLWQTPEGVITYGTADHRPAYSSAVVGLLPCDVIADGLVWAESMDAIVNQVTVSWGPQEGLREEATHSDEASIDAPWGLRHVDIATICALEADAEQFALLVLARRAQPYWGHPSVTIYADQLDAAGTRLLARLDTSAPVLVPFTTTPGPVPSGPTAAVVEGWIETWDAGGHTLLVALSDQQRWVRTTLRSWAEVRDGGTWAHWAAGSWLEQLVKENP